MFNNASGHYRPDGSIEGTAQAAFQKARSEDTPGRMKGGKALNLDRSFEFRHRMDALVHEALTIADASPDARDLGPVLNALTSLVEDNPEQWEIAVNVFLGLLDGHPEERILGRAGSIEILEFSMHRLRLPSIRRALSELVQTASDWTVKRWAERVLEAYEDDWPGRDIYGL